MAIKHTVGQGTEPKSLAAPPSLRRGFLQAGPLAVAGLLANGGSLLVTVVLARLLTSHDYGALNQLIGVFFVVSTPGSAVLVAVVRRVAAWRAADGDVAAWAAALHRRATWALGAFCVATAAAGPALASALGRHDPGGLDAIAVAGAVWVLLCADRGLLQAQREYRTLSANLLTEGSLRTACMLGAGAAGLGVTGIAAGVLVAEIGTALQARVMADHAWRGRDRQGHARTGRPTLARRWASVWQRAAATRGAARLSGRDVAVAVVSLAAIAVLQYVDVIVMGREGPHEAGAYAAVSVSSKVLVFLALVVGGYLLPEAAHSWRQGAHALRQLSVTLLLVGVPAALLVGVAALFPRRFLTVFFSARYVSATGAFLPLALAMVCLSGVVLVTMYLLAVGDRRIAVILVVGAAAASASVASAHGVPRATAIADLAVQACLAAVSVGELALVHRRRGRKRPRAILSGARGRGYARRR